MISKEQFVLLIEGMKEHNKYEDDFNKAFQKINSSHTAVELAPKLHDAIFNALVEDFSSSGHDFIFDYVFQNLKIFEWTEQDCESGEEIPFSYRVTNAGKLYHIMVKHFSYENN